MRIRSPSSLKSLLLTHELAFLFLVAVTGVLGGLSAYFWHQTSAESVRINILIGSAQQIRSDLFRQIKEVTRARLMEDPKAVTLYTDYSRRIDEGFNELRRHAVSRPEDIAIQSMQRAYRVIQKDMNNIFSDPYAVREARIMILNPRYEERVVGSFEEAFKDFEAMLSARGDELDRTIARWTRFAPIIMPIPIVLAIGLLLFSRRIVQKGFVRPMTQVVRGARIMSGGQLAHKIPLDGVEEVRDLAQQINTMAADLASSRDALIESEKQAALGALVPVVAHNIRNPLASIRAAAQVLDVVHDTSELQEAKQAILATIDRLSRWVSALMSYLHPLKPQPQRAHVGPLLNAALTLLKPKLEEKAIRIKRRGWGEDQDVYVDVDLMEQALYGLLANAVDASPEGGALVISMENTQEKLTVHIRDCGPGMRFDPKPGNLAPGPSTKRFGTGLGIPIAFKICQAHGWTLDFNSNDSGGTEVVIAAPRATALETLQ
ncbi:MAG: HAMP domain-containing histidine kinase [Gammaproteobacteria bacterium]|nr:HAMP domain-containing histidine kinase [Gammaproteobacteria bacterium]